MQQTGSFEKRPGPYHKKARQTLMAPADGLLFTLREYPVVYPGSLLARILTGGEETLYELETPYRQKFKIRGFRFEEGEKACAMVAAVLRYLSRVGLLRYHCHSGYLSTVVQENEMANVLTPAGGIFRRFVEPGQEVEYGQKMGVILDPFTAEVEAEITCPTSGVVFFALKKPLTTEHEVAFKVIRRLHGGCL